MNQAFEQNHQTFIDFTTKQNLRIGNTNTQQLLSAHVSEFRQKRSEIPSTDERDTAISEPALPLYKQLTSLSINDEALMESTNSCSSGSVPTRNHLTAQTKDMLLKNT